MTLMMKYATKKHQDKMEKKNKVMYNVKKQTSIELINTHFDAYLNIPAYQLNINLNVKKREGNHVIHNTKKQTRIL